MKNPAIYKGVRIPHAKRRSQSVHADFYKIIEIYDDVSAFSVSAEMRDGSPSLYDPRNDPYDPSHFFMTRRIPFMTASQLLEKHPNSDAFITTQLPYLKYARPMH